MIDPTCAPLVAREGDFACGDEGLESTVAGPTSEPDGLPRLEPLPPPPRVWERVEAALRREGRIRD